MNNQKLKLKYSLYSIKNAEFLGINLTKDGKDMYAENYKILLRKIKELNK